jgi:2,4-dienoyl-CoA reductase-like NADH-dependent reductase (Old Yellow Enzyme family)
MTDVAEERGAQAQLAEPLLLPCGVRLPNRLAKAAMSEQLADRHNRPTPELSRLYERWSRSGAGLLVTGNVMIERAAVSEPRQVVLDHVGCLPTASRWAATHRDGPHLWLQLNHGGRQIPRLLCARPEAPSAVRVAGPVGTFGTPRVLTEDRILELVERFATASGLAMAAGFSGVQIHAAHGYLISQFLSPATNRRDDDWGGTPDRRRRFLQEVVRAVRRRVGPGVPVSVKLNTADAQRGGVSTEEALGTVRWLADEGVDLIELSGGTFEQASMVGRDGSAPSERTRRREAYFLAFAEQARNHCHAPLMVTGGFRSVEAMVAAIASGAVDVVGLARPMACDPMLPARLLSGEVARSEAPILVMPRVLRPVPMLAGMAEVAWHTEQLRRLGAGRDPRPRRRVTASVLSYTARQTFHTLARRLERLRRAPRRGRRGGGPTRGARPRGGRRRRRSPRRPRSGSRSCARRRRR